MNKGRITFYEVLLYVAYSFFILLGLSWFLVCLVNGTGFNSMAFFITVVFGAQAYYRHRLTNLVLGILSLFFTIYMTVGVMNTLLDKNTIYDGFIKATLWLLLFSIIMSVIIVFGYLKMSFKDQ